METKLKIKSAFNNKEAACLILYKRTHGNGSKKNGLSPSLPSGEIFAQVTSSGCDFKGQTRRVILFYHLSNVVGIKLEFIRGLHKP